MKSTSTWVLVADEAIARILEQPQAGAELVPVEELTDPDAHATESELHHGPHGRRGTNATVSAGDSERHQHAKLFAGRIAERLAHHHRDRRFDELHVVAAPRLLGLLRGAIETGVWATVVSTLDKDLVKESNADLTRRLFGWRSAAT